MEKEYMCPFCIENDLLRVNVLYEDDFWYVTDMKDGSISNAVMAITKRHTETAFDINEQEWLKLHALINKMKKFIDSKEEPQGYNLGWNINTVGGQNVAHAHLHLLARYEDEPLAGKGIRNSFKSESNRRPSVSSS